MDIYLRGEDVFHTKIYKVNLGFPLLYLSLLRQKKIKCVESTSEKKKNIITFKHNIVNLMK